MGFFFAHAGNKLQKVTSAGVPSDLSLPSGVTVSTTRRARFASMGNFVAAVHAPSINLAIDVRDLTVYPLSCITPVGILSAAAGVAGVLTGVYSYKVTYAVYVSGELVSESPLSLPSADVTLAAQQANLTNIQVSPDAQVTHRRIYRTTSNGSVYFLLDEIGNNTATTYTDNTADAGLSGTAAPTDIGNPYGSTTADYFRHITSWKGRLWATSNKEIDRVFFTGVHKFYGWPSTYNLAINPTGQSGVGVNGFLPRRDELGVSKEEGLWKIIGTGVDNFQVLDVYREIGPIAPESIVIIRDTAFFLTIDGVYAWGSEGVVKLSGPVDPWFLSDDYFDRSEFANAFARWNALEDTYELHLSAAGSAVADRWVSYDITRKLWLGPHKTSAFTPTCAGNIENVQGIILSVMGGSDSHIYKANGADSTDEGSAIVMDFQTAWHLGGDPNTTKVWGDLSLHTAIETGGTLLVLPYVGGVDATSAMTLSHDLTKGREGLGRLGVGRLLSLRFQQSTDRQACGIYAYQLPVSVRGTR